MSDQADAAFEAPTPLLCELERSLAGKTTVAQCLRSKVVPSAEVVRVLEKEQQQPPVDRSEVYLSYCEILSKYLGTLADRTSNSDATRQQHTSLYFMERIATTCRFLQLLLEFREAKNEPENESGESVVYVTASIAGDVEICKMILQLIRSLVSVVCGSMETATTVSNNKSIDTDDGSTTSYVSHERNSAEELFNSTDIAFDFDATKVSVFAFGSLLRINYYCSSRPFLLSALWKGLCEIAGAVNRNLPRTLIKHAVSCIADHLHDGLEPVLSACSIVLVFNENLPDATEQAFVVKILGFLVARLTVFFKLTLEDDEESSAAMAKAVHALVLLRGIGVAVESASAQSDKIHKFLAPYHELAFKVDKCFTAWFTSSGEVATRLTKTRLIVQSEPAQQWFGSDVARLANVAAAAGKCYLLTPYLEDAVTDNSAVWHETDVKTLLAVVEELLFRLLPGTIRLESQSVRSTAYLQLLSRSMRAISATTLRIEIATACVATNASPGRARFHRLLMNWFHVSGPHPLSLQLVISVIHTHVTALCGDADDVIPLLTLMVKLLIDYRTGMTLRTNISLLLSRLLRNPAVHERLQLLLRAEYTNFERAQLSPTKRKRSSFTNRYYYDREQLAAILLVLSKLNVRVGFESLISMDRDEQRMSRKRIQGASIHAALSDYSFGSDYVDLVEGFLEVWKEPHDEPRAFLAVTVMQQSYGLCTSSSRGLSDQLMEAMLEVLRVITEHIPLDVASQSDSEFLLAPVFEAISVLGVVGPTLLPTTPKHLLSRLAQCFYSLLSCPSWPLNTHAMESLVQFASTVPSTHKDVLPKCLPKAMHKLLQFRLQGAVSGKLDSLTLMHIQCVDYLFDSLLPRRGPDTTIFPLASTCTFPTGSFVMSMPTQDDRKAIVIFPPGEKSLDDIRFMLGVDEEDDDSDAMLELQTLQRVFVLPDGGCKLRLQQQ